MKKIKGVESKYENTRLSEIAVLKMHQCFIMSCLEAIKRRYNQTFKSKDKKWRLKHGYKNLKDLDYQPDQLVLPKWVKVTINRFNEIQSLVTEASVDGKN